ncbi:hypothetical protein Indivirus_11_8 [Indivirus ILV1]|uniref:Uncharacterized protein n=1 Tax=Indivirus ILV1 TaxID=1977633 RepID=A0A1V0SEL0_9VIRU|nr:hypothetical protein Indivirus_11_8 [Indivirus ILV1]
MNDVVDKQVRRAALITYLTKVHNGNHDLEEHSMSYEHKHWTDELICERYYLDEAIREGCVASGYDETKYREEHAYELRHNGRLGELEDRELAVQEWFEDHGLDHSLDPDMINRDKYIWWYHNSTVGLSVYDAKLFCINEVKKRTDIQNKLVTANVDSQKLYAELRPF